MREQIHHHTCLNKRQLSDRAAPGTPNLLRFEEADVHTKNQAAFAPGRERTIIQNFNI